MLSGRRIEVLKAFCAERGLNFKNFELLNRAFCHTSYVHENNMDRIESYERLEFLGDAVLKLVISDILFFEFPDEMEGLMTEKRAAIVSDRTIAKFAEKLNFKNLILTGKGENQNQNKSVFACSFEALLGAIYIEEGYLKARDFLLTYFKDDILNVEYSNPKEKLQEITQKLTHNI
ncbi:MAG: hypothetical protein LUE64_01545, partial [Candidatus Gastranaerophilales bacterium]|nr:hypothetical protein [Candidatus Gastranaerophilales bacterium]